MQIRPDRAPEPAPLVAALPVVPDPGHDSPEGRGPGIEMGPARPPYQAPDDAQERITKRLPELYDLVPAMRPEKRVAVHAAS